METRKHHYLALLLIGSSLLFSSCTTTNVYRSGSPIDEIKVGQIKDGITTLNEIISLFGAPQSASANGDKTLFIYQYSVAIDDGSHKKNIDSISVTTNYFDPTVYNELKITFSLDAKVESHIYQNNTNRK
jgi:hypothetical protein